MFKGCTVITMEKKTYFLFFLPFLFFVGGYISSYIFFQTTVITVPSIVGKSLQDATQLLSKNRLGLRLRVLVEDSSLQPGVILDQVPQVGQKVRPNQNVFVSLSAHSKPFKMIDGWAKMSKDIKNLLHDRGLEVTSVYLSSHYPKGLCIGQSPLPSQQIIDKKAFFYFSDGISMRYVVPDFRGHAVADVESSLGFDSVKIEIFHQDSFDDDHQCSDCLVVAQYPLPGEIVDLSTDIHIQLQVEAS